MKIYAYARVSTSDQNLSRQLDAFKKFGLRKTNIYTDKKSGKDFERINYKKLIDKHNKGDLLVIKSIDRLGRNYTAIIEEWRNITHIIGADICVLDMPLLDTRSKYDSLTRKLISDIVLQVLSFVAENERVNIRERQKEGIAAAMRRGVQFGRPRRLYDEDFINTIQKFKNNEITTHQAATHLSVNRTSLYFHLDNLTKLGFIY